jgi:hypothetical protein
VFLFIVGFVKIFDESSHPARARKLQNDAKKITARRREEQKPGLPIKPWDQDGIPLIEPLT